MPSLRRQAVLAAARIPHVYGLTKLGQVFGTDKVDPQHTHNGLAYTDVYERYLRSWRWRRFTLLELGVFRGDSLRMWNAFFPRATVAGIDLEPLAAARAPEFDVAVGSQADPEALEGILRRHPDVRIVVDDASHIPALTMASFRFLFPRLPSGSLYIMEDLSPGTYEDWPGHHPERGAHWPGSEENPGSPRFTPRKEMDDFLLELVHDCDLGCLPFGEDARETGVGFVHVWPAIIVVGRA